jgi:hypothetical protein
VISLANICALVWIYFRNSSLFHRSHVNLFAAEVAST